MRFRYIELVRAGWGVVLVVAPRTVLSRIPGARVQPKSVAVSRILGVRHLVQACLSGVAPSPEILAAGVWVDLVHSMTAFGLAVTDHRYIRAAMVDSVVAAAWSAAGFYDLRTAKVPAGNHARLRNRLARSVFGFLPGGRRLMNQAHTVRAEQKVEL
jgi:hypothetical protein